MERALKSFLDGISEDDNVVNLENVVKNDNDGDDDDERQDVGVISQSNASGMLDMRAMAQRYQEMSTASFEKPVDKTPIEAPLPGQIVRQRLLAPVVETEDAEESKGMLIAGVALAVLVTIVSTAAITATLVRRSVMAEIHEMGIVPGASAAEPAAVVVKATVKPTQPPAATATAAGVAEWPEPDPSLVAATEDDDQDPHLEMNFLESEVGKLPKRRSSESSGTPSSTTTPRPTPATTTATTPPVTTATAPAVTTPQPATTPQPKQVTSSDGEPCDEVLCLVEGRGCCGNVRKKAAPVEEEVDTSLPERLAREDIQAGLTTITGRLSSCGSRFAVSGAVTLKLKVNAAGKVQSSSVNKGDAEFKSCISQTLKKARFAKTQKGASLSYPVIMR